MSHRDSRHVSSPVEKFLKELDSLTTPNVRRYLSEHPGGYTQLSRLCGDNHEVMAICLGILLEAYPEAMARLDLQRQQARIHYKRNHQRKMRKNEKLAGEVNIDLRIKLNAVAETLSILIVKGYISREAAKQAATYLTGITVSKKYMKTDVSHLRYAIPPPSEFMQEKNVTTKEESVPKVFLRTVFESIKIVNPSVRSTDLVKMLNGMGVTTPVKRAKFNPRNIRRYLPY